MRYISDTSTMNEQLESNQRGKESVSFARIYHFSERLRVHQFPVMSDCQCSVCGVHHKRLAVDFLAGRACAVPGMTDSKVSFELLHILIVENVIDHSHTLVDVERL